MAEQRTTAAAAGPIALSEVAHVSSLARLGLTPEELKTLAAQLELIVAAVGKLSAADTASVEATAQVGDLRNVTRADVVAPGLSQEQALANSATKEAGFFRVPAIQ
ncbi:MAG TPA: Asp-tRNA(Asn)/Glu-tRNA(Gln) amidotransferase subunit GatC [Candidatus Saccharimonadales bacterium]|nr:Asp-tRNA(Asn)/Glu-tRNA(Gln) amidotransferase subunit GatC [Candidatus Saccharimonadales bacterium]